MARTKSGIPLLTGKLAEAPRINIGWPAPTSAKKASTSIRLPPPLEDENLPTLPSPERKKLPGAPQAKKESKSPKREAGAIKVVDMLKTQAEILASGLFNGDIDRSQCQEIMTYLIGPGSAYEVFSSVKDNSALPYVLYISDIGSPPIEEEDTVDTGLGQWYQDEKGAGARVKIRKFVNEMSASHMTLKSISADPRAFFKEVEASLPISVSVMFADRINVLWISSKRELKLFDPKAGVFPDINGAIRELFRIHVPTWNFKTLEEKDDKHVMTVYHPKTIFPTYLSEYYCLLYIKRRMTGMNYVSATTDLITTGIDSKVIIKELYLLIYTLALTYHNITV